MSMLLDGDVAFYLNEMMEREEYTCAMIFRMAIERLEGRVAVLEAAMKEHEGVNVQLGRTEMKSAEQKARDLLERLGMENAQSLAAGDVVELANLIDGVRCVCSPGTADSDVNCLAPCPVHRG